MAPLCVRICVDLLELVIDGPDMEAQYTRLKAVTKSGAMVLLLRALGEVHQTPPLELLWQYDPVGIPLGGRFSFCTHFDSSWPVASLRSLLSAETLRVDLLHVPLEASIPGRADLGAQRVAAYRLCPWPWLLGCSPFSLHGLCGASKGREECAAKAGPRVETGPWLRVKLWTSIAEETETVFQSSCQGLHLAQSGDVVEIP
mmetsp:Transcript_63508/g.112973  ORF Transcript_63508/g.112973 Transcript_63508/m.112973 type:complete len:201 (+) Transcript_63508:46-648(+)